MADLMDTAMRRAAELVRAVNPESLIGETQLKEFLNSAKSTCLLRLANQGVTSLRREVILSSVPANTTALSTTTTPSIPSMLAPVRLWERSAGATGWTGMIKAIDHLPVNAVQGPSMLWWYWRNGQLEFIGASAIVDLKIHYMPRGDDFEFPRDEFEVPDLVNPCAFLAASRALGGNPYYESVADGDLTLIASIDAHVQQASPIRLRRRRSGTRRI